MTKAQERSLEQTKANVVASAEADGQEVKWEQITSSGEFGKRVHYQVTLGDKGEDWANDSAARRQCYSYEILVRGNVHEFGSRYV